MNDDIELPPLPPVLGAPGMNLWIDDLRRAAVLADRKRRSEQAKPVVHSAQMVLTRSGYAWTPDGFAPLSTGDGSIIITLRWTADGRAWIDSEKNRDMARRLRVVAEFGYTAPTDAALRDAADVLDGGDRG